jgi:hypothetical protein
MCDQLRRTSASGGRGGGACSGDFRDAVAEISPAIAVDSGRVMEFHDVAVEIQGPSCGYVR